MNNSMELITPCYGYKGSSNISIIINHSEGYGMIDVYSGFNEKITTVFAEELGDLIKDLANGKYA